MITTPDDQKFFFHSMGTLVAFIKESGVNGLIEEIPDDNVFGEISDSVWNRPQGNGSIKKEMGNAILDILLKIE